MLFIQVGPLLNSEKPNLAELHEILNYWQTLLTCLQVQLPEMNADNRGVVHVSHHGTQARVWIMTLLLACRKKKKRKFRKALTAQRDRF